jgi:hypothetical protein
MIKIFFDLIIDYLLDVPDPQSRRSQSRAIPIPEISEIPIPSNPIIFEENFDMLKIGPKKIGPRPCMDINIRYIIYTSFFSTWRVHGVSNGYNYNLQ